MRELISTLALGRGLNIEYLFKLCQSLRRRFLFIYLLGFGVDFVKKCLFGEEKPSLSPNPQPPYVHVVLN